MWGSSGSDPEPSIGHDGAFPPSIFEATTPEGGEGSYCVGTVLSASHQELSFIDRDDVSVGGGAV